MRLFQIKFDQNSSAGNQLSKNLMKIIFCMLLRSFVLLGNILVINKFQSFWNIYYLLFIVLFTVIIEIIVAILSKNRIGFQAFRHSDENTMQYLQQEDQLDQKNEQLERVSISSFKKQRWIINCGWHFIMLFNVILLVFSFISLSAAALNTYLYKLRSMLIFIIFHSSLTILFFMNYPYLFLQERTQNQSGQIKVEKQKQIIRIYSLFQIGFIKYLALSLTIGSLLDYLAYGNSDYISFKYNFKIQFNGNRFTLNQLSFYISILLSILIFGSVLAKKWRLLQKIKVIIDFQ